MGMDGLADLVDACCEADCECPFYEMKHGGYTMGSSVRMVVNVWNNFLV